MIRVNLLENRGSVARPLGANVGGGTATEYGAGGTGVETSLSSALGKAIAMNLAILLTFPAALIYYERYNIGLLRARANEIAGQVSQKQQVLQSKKEEIAQSASLKEKAKELANKISLLKVLARTRLREIKTLDFIQTNLPERVWLKELSFKAGDLLMKGSAVTDDELTVFIRALEKNRSFTKVLLVQAKEERTKDGTVKGFELTAKVEAE